MLAVIDYGGGNLGSLVSALGRRGVVPDITSDPQRLLNAKAAMLPGDGAFAATMRELRARRLDDAIQEFIASGRPFFGICIGLQVLYERSLEHGEHRGLGVFAGTIDRLHGAPRVPHMGWNELEITAPHPLLEGVASGDFVYFLHSYRAPVDERTIAACTYGERFSAVVARGNVVATQFHPEKSQRVGGRILDNYLNLVNAAVL
jgi:glutamine amidotransferase